MRWIAQTGAVRSLVYSGEKFKGTNTEVFAFYASPITLGEAKPGAKFPGVVLIHGGGGIVHDVGHVIDFMPTFLELAGGRHPKEIGEGKLLALDGRSFVPALRGDSLSPRGPLGWRVPQHRALRSGDWKLISKDENSSWELYDLAADGTETTNLAQLHPEVVKRLAAAWQAWSESCDARSETRPISLTLSNACCLFSSPPNPAKTDS